MISSAFIINPHLDVSLSASGVCVFCRVMQNEFPGQAFTVGLKYSALVWQVSE